MNKETTKTKLATKADLQAVETTLIKWIIGTGIVVFVALQVFIRLL